MFDKIFTEEEKMFLKKVIKDLERKKEKIKYLKLKSVPDIRDYIEIGLESGECVDIHYLLSTETELKLYPNKEYTLYELGLGRRKKMKLKDIEIKKGDVVYFKDEINKAIVCFNDVKINEYSNIVRIERPVKYKTIYEETKEILTKEEKEYLEYFLKPFKDEILYIMKVEYHLREYIYIHGYKDANTPCFDKGTMFKGMKLDEGYALYDLGLFKE